MDICIYIYIYASYLFTHGTLPSMQNMWREEQNAKTQIVFLVMTEFLVFSFLPGPSNVPEISASPVNRLVFGIRAFFFWLVRS